MISSQLMHRDIVTIRPIESIRAAAKKMRDRHADMVVVLEDDGRFRGVLTEKEVIIAAMNSWDAEQAVDDSAKRKDLLDFAYDDGNRCNYFSEVAIDLLMNSCYAGQAVDDNAKPKDLLDFACDDEDRCNYFSKVAIDVLMSG